MELTASSTIKLVPEGSSSNACIFLLRYISAFLNLGIVDRLQHHGGGPLKTVKSLHKVHKCLIAMLYT